MQYSNIISIESLFQAWDEFKKGKRAKKDVRGFERQLEDNLFNLHSKLRNKTYKHGSYESFYVNDPKRRHIHKASVSDRIVHHLLYKFLYELWDKTFIKHKLKVKYYLRYADDFVVLSEKREYLKTLVAKINEFLETKLKLSLHPSKIFFRKYTWGIDFLGYVVLPHYILPKTKTKRRMFRKLREKANSPNFNESLQSYLGYLSHSNSYKLAEKLKMLELF